MVHWRNNCAYEEAVKVRKDTGLGIYSAQNRAGSYTPFGAILLGCGANSIWNIGEKIAGWCTDGDKSSSESSDVQRYKDQIDSILSVHSVGNISELGLLLESKRQELFDTQGRYDFFSRQVTSSGVELDIIYAKGTCREDEKIKIRNLEATIEQFTKLQEDAATKIETLKRDIEKLERDCAAVKEYTEKLENLEQNEYINSQVNEDTKKFTELLQQLNNAQKEGKSDTDIDYLVEQITTAYTNLGGDNSAPNYIKTAYGFLHGEIAAANGRKRANNPAA